MKILLVEDSQMLLDRLRTVLAGIPTAQLVGEAKTEQDALGHMASAQPDIVVLDLNLLSGSGLNVLKAIKARHDSTIVVILTNFGQREYRVRCLSMGADYFFDKTSEFESFIECLRTLCHPLISAAQPAVKGAST